VRRGIAFARLIIEQEELMPQQNEPSKAHGDPLEQVIANNPEDNRGQRDSDAPPDATADRSNNSDRAGGRGSDANGVPAFDEADGAQRKRQYEDGSGLISGID
jgi:hypothetical protein